MMYAVKIGNFQKIYQNCLVKMLFSPSFPHFEFVVFYQPNPTRAAAWSKIYIRKKKFFHQNPSMEVIQQWHRKSSLWRLFCVTQTSL